MPISTDAPLRRRLRFRWSLRALLLVIGALAIFFAIAAPHYRSRPQLWENALFHEMLSEAPLTEVFKLDPSGPIAFVMDGAEVDYRRYPIALGPRALSNDEKSDLFTCLVDESTYSHFDSKHGTDWHYRIRVIKGPSTLDCYLDNRTGCIIVKRDDHYWYFEGMSSVGQKAIMSVIERALARQATDSSND